MSLFSSSNGSIYSSSTEDTWITDFCNERGHELFCVVDEDYVEDDFNLTGLSNQVPHFDLALDTILDIDVSPDVEDAKHAEQVEDAARTLYGLIHARFILTNDGLWQMRAKYIERDFRHCPRFHCKETPLVPCGVTDVVGREPVKFYCPRCQDLFHARQRVHNTIDGAYFGTTFPHLFLLMFPELQPAAPTDKYVPKIFGFRVHRSALDLSYFPQKEIEQKDTRRRDHPSKKEEGAQKQKT